MSLLENAIRNEHDRIIKSVKDSIDNSNVREIDPLPNGDKFVHDLTAGYIKDEATGQIKGWRVIMLGGEGSWTEAEFMHNGIIGIGCNWGLYPKPQPLYGRILG